LIPTAPPHILGLLNWRDHVVPVIDLANRLAGKTHPNGSASDQTHLVVIRGMEPDTYVAFPAQSNLRLLRLPVAHQASTRTLSLNQDFIQGIFELKQETLAILNIAKILRLEC
jgi:purine-binding chemotaxis protein CheW